MPRPPWSALLGPELLWGLIVGLVYLAGLRNHPPTEAGSQALERLWWWVPLLGVPLAFAGYLLPDPGRWSLLARIDLSCLVGIVVAAGRVASDVDYGDSRNSGVAAGWIMSIALGLVLLGVGNVVTAIALWRAGSD